jgi:erythromycin esterase
VRSARELVAATHVLLRALVEQAGFRAVAIEGTQETGMALDRFVRTGAGDPAALLAASQSFLRVHEALTVVRSLRAWTREHPDDPLSIVHDPTPYRAPAGLTEAEAALAHDDLTWHADTGQRIVHWGGTAHLVVGDPRTIPPGETQRNAGGIMHAGQTMMVDAPHEGAAVRVESFPFTVGARWGSDVYLGAATPRGL